MEDKIDRTLCPQLLKRHAYTMVNDKHLCLRSKGLCFYMLLKPEGWEVSRPSE